MGFNYAIKEAKKVWELMQKEEVKTREKSIELLRQFKRSNVPKRSESTLLSKSKNTKSNRNMSFTKHDYVDTEVYRQTQDIAFHNFM